MPKFAVLYLISVFIGLAANFIIDVSWGVYLYQLNYFLNPTRRWWYSSLPDLRYAFFIAICILLAYLFNRKRYFENRLFAVPQSKWFILDLLNFWLISYWSVWPEVHWDSLNNHFKIAAFIFIAYKVVDTPQKFERMLWAFLLGSFYTGWVGHNIGRNSAGRLEAFGPSDTGNDGNSVAAILVSTVPIFLFYIIKGRNWQRFLCLFLLAYTMDAIILVNSRGSFLGLLMGGSFFAVRMIFNRVEYLKQKIKIISLLLVGCFVFLYLTDDVFWERMYTITEESQDEMGGGGRKFFWLKSIELVKDYPFGVGTWGYQYLSPHFIPEDYLATNSRRAVHSLYFQALVERGYFGFLIFGALVASNFLFMRKVKKYLLSHEKNRTYLMAISIESGYVTYLTASVFLNHLQAEILFWFMMFFASFGNVYFLKAQRQNKDHLLKAK